MRHPRAYHRLLPEPWWFKQRWFIHRPRRESNFARWNDNDRAFDPFALKPLIYSAGPDKLYEIRREVRDLSDATTYPNPYAILNDPYTFDTTTAPGEIGTPYDPDGDGPGYADNITNHDLGDGP